MVLTHQICHLRHRMCLRRTFWQQAERRRRSGPIFDERAHHLRCNRNPFKAWHSNLSACHTSRHNPHAKKAGCFQSSGHAFRVSVIPPAVQQKPKALIFPCRIKHTILTSQRFQNIHATPSLSNIIFFSSIDITSIVTKLKFNQIKSTVIA